MTRSWFDRLTMSGCFARAGVAHALILSSSKDGRVEVAS